MSSRDRSSPSAPSSANPDSASSHSPAHHFHHSPGLPQCPYRGLCTLLIFDPDHASTHFHAPPCPTQENPANRGVCLDYSEPHAFEYAHRKACCPAGWACTDTRAPHQRDYSHPYRPVCKYGSRCTEQLRSKIHQLHLTHPCRWGASCRGFLAVTESTDRDHDATPFDQQHCECCLHVERRECSLGRSCTDLWDPVHRGRFSHVKAGIPDFGRMCRSGALCELRNEEEHRLTYDHPPEFQPVAPLIDRSDPEKMISLLFPRCNFRKNLEECLHDVRHWLRWKMGSKRRSDEQLIKPPRDLVQYCKEIRPVHRCSLSTFKLILAQECLVSRQFMVEMTEDRMKACVTELCSCPGILRALHNGGIFTIEERVARLLRAVVSDVLEDTGRGEIDAAKRDIFAALGASKKSTDMVAEIERVARRVTSVVKGLEPTGLAYPRDIELGTHQHVFSVVGTNTCLVYGSILLVLKRNIMFHPDFDLTACAATSFLSGKVFFQADRPWAACRGMPDDARDGFVRRLSADTIEVDQKSLFHRSKLNYSLGEEVYELMALELMAKWMKSLNKKTPPSRRVLREYLDRRNSHFNFEGHLPSIVPLSCVDKILISRSDYAELDQVERKMLQDLERDPTVGLELCIEDIRADDPPLHLMSIGKRKQKFVYPDRPDPSVSSSLNGFCFTSLMAFGKDVPLFCLTEGSGSVTLEFRARGPDIHVGFCTPFESTFNKDFPNFHVVINSKYSYCPTSDPMTLIARSHHADSSKMDILRSVRCFDRESFFEAEAGGAFVHYRIEYLYRPPGSRCEWGEVTITVDHGKESRRLKDRVSKIVVRDSRGVGAHCVTFGSWMDAVEFRDVSVIVH